MSATTTVTVADQVQKFWAPVFMKQLRENLLLGALVNREYDGQIKQQGDTVYVSQINAPAGQLKTVGTDADTFDTETLSTSRIPIVANKRAIAGFKFADLVDLQSQIFAEKSEIRDAMLFAVGKQINDYLYSIVSPSTSAPDHQLNSVTDFNASQILGVRLLAAQAKWREDDGKGWWMLPDPSYYNDILSAQTLTSSDYVGDERVVVGGKVVNKRFGFNIVEDNSRSTDTAIAFHPDFMHMVMQQDVRFKVSDLHSNNELAYQITADLVFGAAMGIDGGKKVVTIKAAASG